MIKISDYVVGFLESKGVKDVFTISGGGSMHLLDSLGRSNINYICNHHEQALAMAVEGYSRITEHIGVGIVTTGPGGTNTLTGVMGCWLDSIPSIFISGQVQTNQISEGTGCRQIGDQEFDIVKVMSNVTKYSVMIKNKNSIRYHLEKAYHEATTGRPGPVWIDIPLDIQASMVEENDLQGYDAAPICPSPSAQELQIVAEKLRKSSKPLLVLGGGIRLSKGAKDHLYSLLELYNIPVVTGAHSSVDIINDDYEYYCGRIGILGQRSSNRIIQECDLLISIGSRLPIKMTGYKFESFAKNAYKIIVDIDYNEMHKFNIVADLKIVSDANRFIKGLLDQDCKFHIAEWRAYCKKIRSEDVFVLPKHKKLKKYVSNYYFIEKLSELIPSNVPTVTSNGSAHVITLQTMKLRGNQRLFTNVGCASMGYGLPASIGACFANNKNSVVCIEGDGSLQMNIQELQTVVHHQLPLKILVINNGTYLSIKATQEAFFGGSYVGSDPSSGVTLPSLEKISGAYGIPYFSIKNNDRIDYILSEVFSYNSGPIICEVFTYPKEKHEPKVVATLKEDGSFEPGELTNMHISEGWE